MLPTLTYPTFSTTVPSTGQVVKYRPMQVKEHKLLMKVVEFQDETNLIETFRTIIKECAFGLDISKLAMFDVEYLYLKIKGASTGTINTVRYKCNGKNEETGEACKNSILVNLDTELATVQVTENKPIALDDAGIGIRMKYPTFEDYVKRGGIDKIDVLSEEFVLDCVDYIYDKDKIYVPGVDCTREELRTFVDSISESAADKITEFISNIPQVELELPIRCTKCKNEDVIHLRGLDDFLE